MNDGLIYIETEEELAVITRFNAEITKLQNQVLAIIGRMNGYTSNDTAYLTIATDPEDPQKVVLIDNRMWVLKDGAITEAVNPVPQEIIDVDVPG